MLHDLQRGLADVALTNALTPMLERVSAARGSKERRLEVYRTNTLNSLTNVLIAAYPVVERIVGTHFFRATAQAFIAAHPPHQPVLYRYGGAFADFLEGFEPAANLSYLPDVARLEWARIESYFAVDNSPLDPQRLAELRPEQVASVVLTPNPSARLISAVHPVFEIWAANQPEETNVRQVDLAVEEQGLVLRREHAVTQRTIPKGEYAWLNALFAQDPLGTATEVAAATDPDFDLQNTLRQHLAEGTFTDMTASL